MPNPSEQKSTNKEPMQIPYVAHESMMYRLARTNKRLWVALVIALILLLISVVR